MRIFKGFIVLGLSYFLFIMLNACCDKGYFYQWQNIVIQTLSNNGPTDEDNIPQGEFGIRVNLLNTKFDKAMNYIPDPINSAYAAFDCYTVYNKVDTIEKIDVFMLTENGTFKQNVGYYFITKSDSNSEMDVIELVEYLNQSDSYLIEYFDLLLSKPFEEEKQGSFIVDIYLSDGRTLSDTTQTLNLAL